MNCPECGYSNPHHRTTCFQCEADLQATTSTPTATTSSNAWCVGLLGSVFWGVIGVGCAVPVAVVLWALSPIIGLIGGGFVALVFLGKMLSAASTLKGECPYCGHSTSCNGTQRSRGGFDCSACKQRVLVREKRFFRAQ